MSGENLQIVGHGKGNLAVEQLEDGDGAALEEVDDSPLPACIAVDGPAAKIQNAKFNKSVVQIGDVFVFNKFTSEDSEKDKQFVPDAINKLDRLNTELNNTVIINTKEPLKENEKLIKLLKYTILKYTIITVFTVAMITGLIFGAVIWYSHAYDNINTNTDDIPNKNFWDIFIGRGYWYAKVNNNLPQHTHMPHDSMGVVMSAFLDCSSERGCQSQVRAYQADGFSKNLTDIKVNFVIGGDGRIYEGTGWYNYSYKIGDPKDKLKQDCSLLVGVLLNQNRVTVKMASSFALLIKKGLEINALAKTYKIYNHNKMMNISIPMQHFDWLLDNSGVQSKQTDHPRCWR
ncbi:peptidoglycan-recognition protein LF-like isoform X1 [Cimex lectularius]|uniref:Peptidoglycan recognition protein n=1 Tax=Cimex lectularius TaxID=79782 RepID=A0A8I6RLX6_CIMLE|nr:peptidoglycan-recognition protein LF-like isoform X1 [Cimex lectularius]